MYDIRPVIIPRKRGRGKENEPTNSTGRSTPGCSHHGDKRHLFSASAVNDMETAHTPGLRRKDWVNKSMGGGRLPMELTGGPRTERHGRAREPRLCIHASAICWKEDGKRETACCRSAYCQPSSGQLGEKDAS